MEDDALPPEKLSHRVLVITLAGATWRTLTPAIEMGHMPFLRHLVNCGASGTLFSTVPASTAAASATFQTGRNPGSTGIFCSTILNPQSRQTCGIDSGCIERPFWNELDRSGKRVAILSLPLTWPPHRVNGAMVAATLAGSVPPESTWPAELEHELSDHGRPFSTVDDSEGAPHYTNIEDYVERTLQGVRAGAAAAEHIIFTRSPDLAVVHFDACDRVQHALWCHLDTADPLFDEDRQSYIFEHFFGGLDQVLKDICDAFTRAAGGQVSVLIVSDHGFEMHRKRFNLATWLIQQELLQPAAITASTRKESGSLLARLLRPFFRHKPKAIPATPPPGNFTEVDWQKSQTIAIGDGDAAGIYLLSDNDTHRRNATTRIIKGLRAMRDPFTSAPLTKAIYRREELYHGAKMELMPDLVVIPSAGYSLTCRGSAESLLIEDVSQDIDRQLGKHNPEGIIVACGPGIADKIGITANLADAAPTILYMLGIKVPPTYDGKIAVDIFTEDFLASHRQQ
jgi:predicted AlkP superfamily phosphohydrolase/phosphomutase